MLTDALGKVAREIAADPGYAEEMPGFHASELKRWTEIVGLSGAAAKN